MGNIVWLASYPKSGNTWIRAFLANVIANRPTPVPLAELPNYGKLEADPELYSQIAGRPSTEFNFDEITRCVRRCTPRSPPARRARCS